MLTSHATGEVASDARIAGVDSRMNPPTPVEYGPAYYGAPGWKPTANYRGYSPRRMPHWVEPLAWWLLREGQGPYLDAGAAFGHLAGFVGQHAEAVALEWSEYATLNAICQNTVRADGRHIPLADNTFGTITSLDFLEHFEPEETRSVMRELIRVQRPGGLQVHLVGHGEEKGHYDDPTHRNHEGLEWYVHEFRLLGYTVDWNRVGSLNRIPTLGDWQGRWLVLEESRG